MDEVTSLKNEIKKLTDRVSIVEVFLRSRFGNLQLFDVDSQESHEGHVVSSSSDPLMIRRSSTAKVDESSFFLKDVTITPLSPATIESDDDDNDSEVIETQVRSIPHLNRQVVQPQQQQSLKIKQLQKLPIRVVTNKKTPQVIQAKTMQISQNIMNNTKRSSTNNKCFCRRTYKNHLQLQSHIRNVHQRAQHSRVPCPYCNKMFLTPSRLRSHVVCHTGEKKHLCPIEDCDKRYTQAHSLKKHMMGQHEMTDVEIRSYNFDASANGSGSDLDTDYASNSSTSNQINQHQMSQLNQEEYYEDDEEIEENDETDNFDPMNLLEIEANAYDEEI